MAKQESFRPYIGAEVRMKEFTLKAVVLGSIFGVLFGGANVYLALRAGLTVSASIPIAVMAITLGRVLFRTTILENNIIQTTGSAGESIASGVAFTLPGFLFLSSVSSGKYFNYLTILVLAIIGGLLGTLLMIPLRRSLIVKEHGVLPYPEGTACAAVLKAGEQGGTFARTAFTGLGFAAIYAALQKIFHVIAEVPALVTSQANKFFPAFNVSAEVTPEYLGVGYIIGPRIAGMLVAGGVLSTLVITPLLATVIPADHIAAQLVKLSSLKNIHTAGGSSGWDPVRHTFADFSDAIYHAYIRQIGAGAVAAGGLITLIRTIPTILSSFRESLGALKDRQSRTRISRTERDLSMGVVLVGCLVLVGIMALLPNIPGDSLPKKLLIGLLVVLFGAFFVTVSSRIVGIIGSSNNPVSGMTIATVMGTCLVFTSLGWTGQFYEPMALVVGSMICIAAANAGATSQDLKTGFLVGATPRYQQIALFIGAIVSSVVIGITIKILDTPSPEMLRMGIQHAIGSKAYAAPQATLIATLIRGILSFNLDWQYVMVGVMLAVTMELCGVNSLSFAVGAYLPLSTTLPIFAGGFIKGIVDWNEKRKGISRQENDLGSGSLFATGLVAGGALAGVIVALISVNIRASAFLERFDASPFLIRVLGPGGYQILAAVLFAFLGLLLFRTAMRKTSTQAGLS